MGAPSKRARKIRAASEFDLGRLIAALTWPRDTRPSPFAWSIDAIKSARDQQMLGIFRVPARMAASMRTDDAIAVAAENRLAPLRCLPVALKPAKGNRGPQVAGEAEALFGQQGVGLRPETIADINGCLVDHGVAFGVNVVTPRDDGSRLDFEHRPWPIDWVRWDPIARCFKTLVDPSTVQPGDMPTDLGYGVIGPGEVPIIHGDGRWVIYKKHELLPFTQEAALLSASLVWARHAFATRDWAKGSRAHGNAKLIGELPANIALQDGSGKPTAEAAAFVALLKSLMQDDSPYGVVPAGAKTDFATNSSTAWQVWEHLVQNAEKAAARIYLGTDGVLGTQGGAPGIDISELFGVAATKVQGDIACMERSILTGIIEPWCAMNFGDSTLAPKRRYLVPDEDEDARHESFATRNSAFLADVTAARTAGITVTQDYLAKLAKGHGVEAPVITAPLRPIADAPPAAPPVSGTSAIRSAR